MSKSSKAIPFTASPKLVNGHSVETNKQRVLPYAVVPSYLQSAPLNEWL